MSLPAHDPFVDEPTLDPEADAPAGPTPDAPTGPTAYVPSTGRPSRQVHPLTRGELHDPVTRATSTKSPSRPPRRGGGGGGGPRDVAPRPGLIPGLDGLRAIAVVAVLIYHFLPGTLPGGFLGVDIFFVVSGFLISTLLLREMHTAGRVNLVEFWKRRARRLLPALVLVVVVSVSVARLVGEDLLVGIGRQMLGALTFSTNWLEIAAGASYAHSTSPILFMNFWSLAVEEQFYLLWPIALVVLLAFTATTRQRVAVIAGIGIVSTLAMAWLFTPGADPTRVYYGTDTHLMGLMAGAVLAVLWADPRLRAGLRSRLWRRFRGLAVLGAVLVLAGSMRWMTFDDPFTYRGGILLASLATVVLIAGSLEFSGPWRTLMDAKPMAWVGHRSYGIYLWHWPVIIIAGALVPYAHGTLRGWMVVLASLAITLGLAELSLRLVEQPVRRQGLRASGRALWAWLRTPWEHSRSPRVVAGGLAVILILTVIGLVTAPEKSATQRQLEATELRLQSQSVLSLGTLIGTADDSTGPAMGIGPGSLSGVDTSGSGGTGQDGSDGSAAQPGETTTGTTGGSTDDTPANADTSTDAGDDTGAPATERDEVADGEGTADDGESAADLSADQVLVNSSPFSLDADGYLVPAGDTMTGMGDSLIVTSADGLSYRFPGITYAAQSNRQWKDAQAVLDQAFAAGTVRDNVILHLGTNAGVDEAGLRTALDQLGTERNVVVMNLYVTAPFTQSSNETIERVVADYPNVVLGDWHAAATARPEVLQSDRVHPDIEGMHVYAGVVAAAFDELARAQR